MKLTSRQLTSTLIATIGALSMCQPARAQAPADQPAGAAAIVTLQVPSATR